MWNSDVIFTVHGHYEVLLLIKGTDLRPEGCRAPNNGTLRYLKPVFSPSPSCYVG